MAVSKNPNGIKIPSLSDSYNKIFISEIERFNNKLSREQSVFYPSIGTKQVNDVDFLIYGQAVKQWFPLTDDYKQNDFIKKAIEYSNAHFEEHSPLDWVNVYWSKSTYKEFATTEERRKFYEPVNYMCCRSFFWNVVYKLINKYYGFDENSWDWSKKLVWSNLYKIAPAEGLNPNADEIAIQKQSSIKLVTQELEEIKPKYCIILTNYSWWEPFAAELGTTKIDTQKNGIIESVEQYNNTKIIITTRPFAGSSNMHVEKIIEQIQSTTT